MPDRGKVSFFSSSRVSLFCPLPGYTAASYTSLSDFVGLCQGLIHHANNLLPE